MALRTEPFPPSPVSRQKKQQAALARLAHRTAEANQRPRVPLLIPPLGAEQAEDWTEEDTQDARTSVRGSRCSFRQQQDSAQRKPRSGRRRI